MLTDDELQSLFKARGTPSEGQARIRLIRSSLPARSARSNKMSGKTRYAPLKMPFVVEAEAVSTEYVALVECDHDDDVFEFYSQVEPLRIDYLIPGSTRRVHLQTTPDIFKITRDAFVFVECKKEQQLELLAKENPNRFCRDEQGRWRSPPAERAAGLLGCQFEVRSSSQNNWTLHENLELLKDYLTGEPVAIDEMVHQSVVMQLSRRGWVSLFDLIHREPRLPADAVLGLIAQRRLFFPLGAMRLTDQEGSLIFLDEVTYRAHGCYVAARALKPLPVGVSTQAGTSFVWDGVPWRVINASTRGITVQAIGAAGSTSSLADLRAQDFEELVRQGRIAPAAGQRDEWLQDDVEDLLRRASPSDLKEAQARFLAIRALAAKQPRPGTQCVRTLYEWQRKYREAEARYGNGFVGLLPCRSGNRQPKMSAANLQLLEEVIAADWETIRRKSYMTSYGRYRALAASRGFEPVSHVTFWKRAKARGGFTQAAKRIGEKAAYSDEPQYMQLEYTTPLHGVRPWHIAHIDHTPLPLTFLDARIAEKLGTVWLTMLIDAYSRKIIAYYLSFDEPSYRSCMMVLRDCVRRHNRVPQIIISDQGPEFNGQYWETQVAMVRCTKRERRAGRPRDGSVCERLFRTTQSQFVTNLLGATDIVEQHFRSISPEVRPERYAVWTLEHFDVGFQRYLDEVLHKNHHQGIGMSPDEAWALGMRSFGTRDHLAIPYDDVFIAQSCPAVTRGTAKVTSAGIKIKGRWFKSEALAGPGIVGTKVHARYDPFNAGIAYAFIHGQWHRCFSQYFASYAGLSEKAIWLATEHLRLVDRNSGRQASINAERLAVHLMTVEQEEVALQQQRDLEASLHRARINAALPDAPSAASGHAEHVTVKPEARPVFVPQPLEDL